VLATLLGALPRRIQSWDRLLHHCLTSGDLVSTPAYLTLEEVVARYRGQVSEGTLRKLESDTAQ
jgi:hypothetical protein